MRDDIERWIGNAAKGGWNWFDSIRNPDVKDRVRLELDRTEDERGRIGRAWKAFADTPDGAAALAALWDTTLGRTVYFSQLGIPADQVNMAGAFREGQNALATEIFRQVNRGRESEGHHLKPRETDHAISDERTTAGGGAPPVPDPAPRGRGRGRGGRGRRGG